jgi:hypothetical protein
MRYEGIMGQKSDHDSATIQPDILPSDHRLVENSPYLMIERDVFDD